MSRELIIDSFAGGGGASTGIEMALGRSPDVAINHDPVALAMHRANHCGTEHLVNDIWGVDPMSVRPGEPIGLLWASPDCFPAGTLVLTREGYRPIEKISVGDLVLTHKGRWRPVTALMSGTKATVTIRAQGHPGLSCSDGHRFWARQEKRAPALWTPARALGKGSYLASPRTVEALPLPDLAGASLAPEFWWIVGRYLADGWADTKRGLILTVGPAKAEATAATLERSGLRWIRRETATAVQFVTYNAALCRWLHRHFGHLAYGKRLPGWVLGMPEADRRRLLRGYVDGDGYRHDGLTETSSGAAALAYGLRSLCETLGFTCRVYRGENRETTIDGRTIRAILPMFKLRYRERVAADHRQTVEDDLHRWYPVRAVEPAGEQTVYNITVDEDHSYVVEGIVAKNCKHFSKAKGAALRDRNIRDLAWVVVDWAEKRRPRVICLENVEEFRTWGPVGEDGQPIKAFAGITFEAWVGRLRKAGYRVQFRELRACDYGTPTIRKRLFMVARRDGRKIVWPKPTHGDPKSEAVRKGKLLPWRTAAECIDWSLPCPSIFDSAETIMRKLGVRAKRPLAEATLRRIARGITRYVIENPRPFIVSVAHGDSGGRREYPLEEPVGVQTGAGGQHALVTPVITYAQQGGGNRSAEDPLHTICATPKDQNALVAPVLVPRYGERPGQEPRCLSVEEPSPVVVPTGNGAGLVAAFLAQHNDGPRNGGISGRPIEEPISTISSTGAQQQIVAAHLTKFHGNSTGAELREPAPTITANSYVKRPGGAAPIGMVAAHLANLHGTNVAGADAAEPLRTVGAEGNHAGLVAAFLTKYYGTGDGAEVSGPMHTETTRDRFGLVTVSIDGQTYAIVDIGMRMLTPRERFRAQGFPDDYIIDEGLDADGHPVRLTAEAQGRCCGNSVCPPLAAALVAANCSDLAEACGPDRRIA